MSKTRQYAAFLRGVMPTNAKMSDLVKCFEAAGLTGVKTVLGSGNVIFTATAGTEAVLERKVEKAMDEHLGRVFFTIVRPLDDLRALLARDPFASFRLPGDAKRVVTFSRENMKAQVSLPVERDGTQILRTSGHEAFTAYVRSPHGPVFMELIKEVFGDTVTTRTWDTIKKIAAASAAEIKLPR